MQLIVHDTKTFSGEADDESTLGSLSDFTVLRRVRVPLAWLLGRHPEGLSHSEMPLVNPLDSLLPASLVTLELDLFEEWRLSWFMKFTGFPRTWECTRGALPHLERLVIRRSAYDDQLISENEDLGPNARDLVTIMQSIEELSVIPRVS